MLTIYDGGVIYDDCSCVFRESPHIRIRASSSAALLIILLVQYVADRGCTREGSGIVGRSIHVIK